MQEPPAHQYLFKRITRVTLIFGILLGIWVTLSGLGISIALLGWPVPYVLAFSLLPNLFMPLQFFLIGALVLLWAKRRSLLNQLPVLGQSTTDFELTASLVLGLNAFGLGIVGCLLELQPNLAFLFPFAFFGGLLGSGLAIWYLQRRGHRRAAQP